MKKNAFSMAEAFVGLLVVSVALGVSAPMITKQIKSNNSTDAQITMLKKEIENLKESIKQNNPNNNNNDNDNEVNDKIAISIPAGAIMFFNLNKCPKNWEPVDKKFIGHYPRIVGEYDVNLNQPLEQMVHKHKHVSPKLEFMTITLQDAFRYGPYAPSNPSDFSGDNTYPKTQQTAGFSGTYAGALTNAYMLYTSDGMNRVEKMRNNNILTCPNRDEDDKICKRDGNIQDIPYLEEMPLVGNENRPNSVRWLACQKQIN